MNSEDAIVDAFYENEDDVPSKKGHLAPLRLQRYRRFRILLSH